MIAIVNSCNYSNDISNYLGCGPGYYGHIYSWDERQRCFCMECHKGTYNDVIDVRGSCTPCPQGTGSTPGNGATSLSDCQISEKFTHDLFCQKRFCKWLRKLALLFMDSSLH